MNILKLDSKLDLDKINNEIEHARIKLYRSIDLEDSSAAIDKLKEQVEQINQVLFRLNTDNETNSDSLLEKSRSLKQIGSILIEVADKRQESLPQTLLQQIKYIGAWFEGTAKQYKIHALAKQTLKPSKEQLIQFIELLIDFVAYHWETHPEEILEREKTALYISEAINSETLDEIDSQIEELSHKFVSTTLLAADKVRLKKLKDSSKSVDKIMGWMINTPGWQGDDLEYCLEIIKNSRVQTEF